MPKTITCFLPMSQFISNSTFVIAKFQIRSNLKKMTKIQISNSFLPNIDLQRCYLSLRRRWGQWWRKFNYCSDKSYENNHYDSDDEDEVFRLTAEFTCGSLLSCSIPTQTLTLVQTLTPPLMRMMSLSSCLGNGQ